MLKEGNGEQCRAGDQQDGPRAAVDPAEITRLKRAKQPSQPKTDRQPPQKRAEPNSEHEDRSSVERRFLAAETDGRENTQKNEDRDRIGERQREGREIIAQEAFGIPIGAWFHLRPGVHRGAADIDQIASACYAQPLLIADQQIGDEGQAEGGEEPEHCIAGGSTEPRNEPSQLAFEDRAADTQDADGADRDGDDDADHDALQQKYQKQSEIPPLQRDEGCAMLTCTATTFPALGDRDG